MSGVNITVKQVATGVTYSRDHLTGVSS